MTKPTFAVPESAKIQLMHTILSMVVPMLASKADGEITADDIVDLFAIGIAAVIDNDTNVKTPGHIRAGADTARTLIIQHANGLRVENERNGASWLSRILEMGAPTDATVN